MTSNPDTVLFDMGGVLFRYDPARRLRYISELCSIPESEIQVRVFDTNFDDQCEAGALDVEKSLSEFNRLCGTDLSSDAFAGAISSAFEPDDIVFGLVKELASTCTLAGLTNNGFVARDGLIELHPDTAAVFGGRLFCSADLGALKPCREAFEGVLERLDRKPENVLFVDDNEDNVRAAMGLGFHIHRFFDAATLETDLRSFGLM